MQILPVKLMADDLGKKNEQQAYVNALFVKNSPRIRGFILSLVPNMALADDVLQETFLTVSSKSEDFAKGSNFVAWACRIAKYKILEASRQNKRTSGMLSPSAIEAVCASELGLQESNEAELAALKLCIDKLSPHSRRAFELRYSNGHNANEVASLLGWTVDSVYVVLSRGRKMLQKCIVSHLAGEQ